MPNLRTEMSGFLRTSDLKKGEILAFADAGRIAEIDFSRAKDGSEKRKVFQITVILPNGDEKLLTVNKTSQNSLVTAYGEQTEKWVGKKCEVDFIQQLVFGKMKDVLFLKPLQEDIEN